MYAELTESAQKFLKKEYALSDIDVSFDQTRDATHGDITTTIALQLAKTLGKNPRDIAAALCKALEKHPHVAKAEVAGAGYVNLWLTPAALFDELAASRKEAAPKKPKKGAKPVIVDYSQPNIAKPLGVHHILSTVIGQTLCNLYRHAGVPVVAWNYLGDWGTQFGKLAVAMEKWGDKKKSAKDYSLDALLELYVRFHNEAEKDASLEDAGREAFRKLEKGDKVLRAFWKDVVSVTKASLGDIYDRLHVTFDLDLGESHFEDKMQPVIDEGEKKGVFKKGQKDATIVEFAAETQLPPAVIVKADGATLYITRDLAMIRYRVDTYHPQQMLYVVDVAQQLHFKQLFEAARMLGWELPAVEHVFFGRMRFAEGKMSTRKGTVLKLEHVLDEAVDRATEIIDARGDAIQTDDPKDLAEMMGTGALVYGILSQNRKMDIVFDWDKMLSFEGNSAPYLQYTHARAKSVLRKAEDEKPKAPKAVKDLAPGDRKLLLLLTKFPSVLDAARTTHMPHTLANYLYELSQAFNAFYNAEPILKAEKDARSVRLFLTAVTADVLKTGAELLTLRVPERM